MWDYEHWKKDPLSQKALARIAALEAERDQVAVLGRGVFSNGKATPSNPHIVLEFESLAECHRAADAHYAIRARSNGAASPTPPQSETVTPHTASDAATQTINHIADIAQDVGFHAGVGAMETAGLIVSVLARNPDQIDRFMQGGAEFFTDGTMMPENGALSWQGMNGEIVTPQQMRERLAKTGNPHAKPEINNQ